jgi:hypothetical protein
MPAARDERFQRNPRGSPAHRPSRRSTGSAHDMWTSPVA